MKKLLFFIKNVELQFCRRKLMLQHKFLTEKRLYLILCLYHRQRRGRRGQKAPVLPVLPELRHKHQPYRNQHIHSVFH